MVTKAKTPAAKAAPKTGTAVVSMKDEMARQLAGLNKRVGAATGAAIRITQDKKFKLPGGALATELDVVIVDFNSRNEYYAGAYDPNVLAGPICAAVGSEPNNLVPDDSSPKKQADNCTDCPQNVFGSSGPGKACKNQRVLAVLPVDATPDTPIMTIKVSPTAIAGFDGYVASVAANWNMPPIGVITTISFNPGKTFASLQFGNPMPNPHLAAHFARQGEAQQILAQIPDMTIQPAPAPAPRGRAPARR